MWAAVSPVRDHLHWLSFYGIDYHSHLATGYGGMAMIGDEIITRIHSLNNSQFKTEFAKDLHLFDGAGNFSIGTISNQAQPISINPINRKLGIFVICISGFVNNAESLAVNLINTGVGFDYDEIDGQKVVNQAKLIGRLVSTKANFVDGINYAFEQVKGSVSILIMNCHGIYAARAKHGQTSLTIGRKDVNWVIASETNAFPNLSITPVRMLGPGEIVMMNEKGVETLREGCDQNCQFCPFYWVYTGSPASEYYELSAESYREGMGELLVRKDASNGFVPYAVSGVADSGTSYAHGYSNGSFDTGFPVRHIRPLIKYTPGWARSYTPEKQIDRDRVALHKQIPTRDKWLQFQGQDIVLTEDSIVRGTQLMQLIDRLNKIVRNTWGLEPANIHIRVGCPVLGWHCPYLGTTKTREEMASRKAVAHIHRISAKNVTDDMLRPYLEYDSSLYHQLLDRIAQDIGATSVLFPTLEEMINLTGLPRQGLCTYCWTGEGV